jgi:hypothetical protein
MANKIFLNLILKPELKIFNTNIKNKTKSSSKQKIRMHF